MYFNSLMYDDTPQNLKAKDSAGKNTSLDDAIGLNLQDDINIADDEQYEDFLKDFSPHAPTSENLPSGNEFDESTVKVDTDHQYSKKALKLDSSQIIDSPINKNSRTGITKDKVKQEMNQNISNKLSPDELTDVYTEFNLANEQPKELKADNKLDDLLELKEQIDKKKEDSPEESFFDDDARETIDFDNESVPDESVTADEPPTDEDFLLLEPDETKKTETDEHTQNSTEQDIDFDDIALNSSDSENEISLDDGIDDDPSPDEDAFDSVPEEDAVPEILMDRDMVSNVPDDRDSVTEVDESNEFDDVDILSSFSGEESAAEDNTNNHSADLILDEDLSEKSDNIDHDISDIQIEETALEDDEEPLDFEMGDVLDDASSSEEPEVIYYEPENQGTGDKTDESHLLSEDTEPSKDSLFDDDDMESIAQITSQKPVDTGSGEKKLRLTVDELVGDEQYAPKQSSGSKPAEPYIELNEAKQGNPANNNIPSDDSQVKIKRKSEFENEKKTDNLNRDEKDLLNDSNLIPEEDISSLASEFPEAFNVDSELPDNAVISAKEQLDKGTHKGVNVQSTHRHKLKLVIGEFDCYMDDTGKIKTGDVFPLYNHRAKEIYVEIDGEIAGRGKLKTKKKGEFEIILTKD